ncbi:MAG: MipA/OmpV family protein, partial [Pseudomonadota bacterium]
MTTMLKRKTSALFLSLTGAAATLTGGSVALAQLPQNDGWSVSAGFGEIFSPTYLGDDAYQLSVLPNIEVRYGNTLSIGVRGIQYTAIDHKGWTLGPVARLGFGRGEDGSNPFVVGGPDTDDLDGLGEIDPSVEFGGFVGYKLGKVSTSFELRKGVGGHTGVLGDVGIRYNDFVIWRGKPLIYTFGPSLSFANEEFNDTFFGIDNEQSSAS